MHILIVSDAWHPQVNGVVRTYEHIRAELQEDGHNISILGPVDFSNRMKAPGYKEIELCLWPYKQLSSKIKALQPEAIHIATEGPLGWAARRYCLKRNIPFTTSYHSQFPAYIALRLSKFLPFAYGFFHRLGVNIIKRFHNKANGVFVTTASMRRTLKDWGIKTPLYEMTRGVDTDIFYPAEKSGLPDSRPGPIALYVGRIAVEKNLEDFLQMDWPGTKIAVGSGPAEAALKKAYPSVTFTGKQTGQALADHYRAADLFVFPSKTDTFGIVLIEALACGLPIAAYPVTGPMDVITNDKLGALNKDLSQAAHQALHSPGTPQDRANHIQEHYTWDIAAQQFLSICHKVAVGSREEAHAEEHTYKDHHDFFP
jgi:glycosyltransferase involved in cell wall biosynthesis